MSYVEQKDGCWCCSDINIVAALMNETGVLRGGTVDVLRRMPAIEYSHAYVKAVDLIEQVPRDGHQPPPRKGHLMRQDEGGPAPGQRKVTRPVVMFALKPFRGTFTLHRKKRRLWFRGKLWVPPHYAVDHRVLLDRVPELLGEYWKKLKREGTPRMKSQGATRIIMDEVAATDREAVDDVNVTP